MNTWSRHSDLTDLAQRSAIAHLAKVLAEYVGYLNPASQHPFIYVVEEKRFC
jgi:hypothetical protein